MTAKISRIRRLGAAILALAFTEFFAAGEDSVNSFLIVQAGENKLEIEAIGADGRMIDSYAINTPCARRSKQWKL